MEKRLYEDLLRSEDQHWWHLAKRKLVGDLISTLAGPENLRLLDFGCGTGRNVEEFSRFGEAWGVDVSGEAINFCRARGIRNLAASAEALPEASFDVVTILDVLEHTDDAATLDTIYKLLKPAGVVIVTVPAYQWLWSGWDEVLHHRRRYYRGTLKRLFLQHGFEVQLCSYLYSFLLLPVLVVRLLKKLICRGDYSSDFKISSPGLNLLGWALTELERPMVKAGLVPFGTSLLVVARRRELQLDKAAGT